MAVCVCVYVLISQCFSRGAVRDAGKGQMDKEETAKNRTNRVTTVGRTRGIRGESNPLFSSIHLERVSDSL